MAPNWRREEYKPETDTVLRRKKVTKEDGEPFKFGLVASGVQGKLEYLQSAKEKLDEDVKLSEEGKQEYEAELARLKERKRFLEERVRKCRVWTDIYEKDIGPMENSYEHLCDEIHVLYGAAKEKHEKGLKLLYEHFNYHPIYKHWDDTFTAVPFKPK
mmetsp:Transcript_29705/g.64865  ORF Transcript_29705/g.64865 Transcript_29705/m.64865 type:complete len:158 (-) Transcript_29705:89-562(-)|eukprot:CAMPEP_0118932076 /NCGR_PEP_ID=MMETSP1169-20130426/9004_1 /TAXON_ID=36882 /ORGANISM="Pyramimonas obovata, Strain CCMP722" /LENGTH=157 /DNA_ID=CAMNT_0006874673 /DNA_START=247 /DNA_END=720 /DNA_ORIENTATION=+